MEKRLNKGKKGNKLAELTVSQRLKHLEEEVSALRVCLSKMTNEIIPLLEGFQKELESLVSILGKPGDSLKS